MYRLGQYVEFSPVTVNMMRKNDYCNIQEVKKINTTDPEANIMQFSDKTAITSSSRPSNVSPSFLHIECSKSEEEHILGVRLEKLTNRIISNVVMLYYK